MMLHTTPLPMLWHGLHRFLQRMDEAVTTGGEVVRIARSDEHHGDVRLLHVPIRAGGVIGGGAIDESRKRRADQSRREEVKQRRW